MYQPWRHNLADGIELVPLELPGRGARFNEPFAETLVDLAAALADQICRRGRGRFMLLGHSLGALVAFEMARHLARWGQPSPQALIVSARCAPCQPIPQRQLHLAPTSQLHEFLRELGGTPESVLHSRELMELLLPIVRADFRLYETYRFLPGTPLTCPIHALAGDQDTSTTLSGMRAWQQHTLGSFGLQFFPGGHFYLNNQQAPVVDHINGLIGELLPTDEGSRS